MDELFKLRQQVDEVLELVQHTRALQNISDIDAPSK